MLIQLPLLPRWIMGIAKSFVKKTSGGSVPIFRDFVGAAKEDVVRMLEAGREKETEKKKKKKFKWR